MNQEKKEIQRYRVIKKLIFYILNISYLLGLVVCMICNFAMNHTLSWFWIVLVSIAISFTITSMSFYLRKNKYRILKLTSIFTILIYLLLIAINYVIKGSWLMNSFAIATFELVLLWIGVLFFTFVKINKQYKIAVNLLLLAVCTIFTNPFCEEVLNISSENNNIWNLIVGFGMIMSAFIIILKNFKIKK